MRILLLGISLLIVAAGGWAVGLVWFLGNVPAATTLLPSAIGDCVAVFTGRNERVRAGTELLRAGGPAVMFVSGAKHGTDPGYVDSLRAEMPALFDCCVTVSDDAVNTAQNGEETAAWARDAGCRRVWLVTDDLHLRRAEVELASRLDGVAVLPWPLPRHVPPGRTRAAMTGVTVWEFNKYVVAWLRRLVGSY